MFFNKMKIDLKKVVLNIKGRPMKSQKLDDNDKIVLDDKGNPEMEVLTIGSQLAFLLGTKFEMKDKNREPFWAIELGIKCSTEKVLNFNFEKEIEKEQLDFLRRIVKDNKIKQQTQTGEKVLDIFSPFVLGQLLQVLEVKKEDK